MCKSNSSLKIRLNTRWLSCPHQPLEGGTLSPFAGRCVPDVFVPFEDSYQESQRPRHYFFPEPPSPTPRFRGASVLSFAKDTVQSPLAVPPISAVNTPCRRGAALPACPFP